MSSTILSWLSVAALAAVVASPAGAHAYLDRALPVAGSVVRESPRELTLWFTQRIEPAFSAVRVLDAAGKEIAAGAPQFDAADGKVIRIPLPKLGPGTYRAKWRVVSVDTHVSEGEFTFDVAP
jgi:copper resistance protein C